MFLPEESIEVIRRMYDQGEEYFSRKDVLNHMADTAVEFPWIS